MRTMLKDFVGLVIAFAGILKRLVVIDSPCIDEHWRSLASIMFFNLDDDRARV